MLDREIARSAHGHRNRQPFSLPASVRKFVNKTLFAKSLMNYAGALIVLNGDIVTKTIWGSHGPGFKRTRQRVLRIKLLSGIFFFFFEILRGD